MNNTMYNKDALYKIALSNVHRYALLNEIFAIKDERFPKEQQETMLCVNGYIGIYRLFCRKLERSEKKWIYLNNLKRHLRF